MGKSGDLVGAVIDSTAGSVARYSEIVTLPYCAYSLPSGSKAAHCLVKLPVKLPVKPIGQPPVIQPPSDAVYDGVISGHEGRSSRRGTLYRVCGKPA